MIINKRAKTLTHQLFSLRQRGKRIGLVPTMGALHAGHLALIEAAKNAADITVGSIFVNPAQFNNPDDFRHYPVTLEKDIEALLAAGCDVLFLPAVDEIYPPGYQKKQYALGRLENILEGRYRPGHFQGVCQAVDRLLEIVQPDQLYLGQKDYQQCMIVSELLKLTGRTTVDLRIMPTVREPDGLAMSSRNLRLNEIQRQKAVALFDALRFIKKNWPKQPAALLKEAAREELERKGFAVDYVEIADAQTLETVNGTEKPAVALVAASLDNVRLIDNLLLN